MADSPWNSLYILFVLLESESVEENIYKRSWKLQLAQTLEKKWGGDYSVCFIHSAIKLKDIYVFVWEFVLRHFKFNLIFAGLEHMLPLPI
jgi:hypothetical protein